ncbi:hypothetical protein BOFL111202_07715 [Bordetella flabilis]
MTDLHDWAPAGAGTTRMFDDGRPAPSRRGRTARGVTP